MRKIIFRAWDKDNEVMIPWEDLRFEKDGDDIIVYSKGDGCFFEGTESELMQYTGLHDKNGKEIYEGDILSAVDVYGRYQGYVSWWKDRWVLSYKVKQTPQLQHQSLMTVANNKEVIGNIYENPDILEKGTAE